MPSAKPTPGALRVALPGLLLIAVLWLALAAGVAWDKRNELAAACRQAHALTSAAATHIDGVLWEASHILTVLALRMRREGPAASLERYAGDGQMLSAAFLGVALVGPDGVLRASSWPRPDTRRPMPLSDRPHVAEALAHPGRLVIGQPAIGRLSGKPSIHLARRVDDENGEPLGVAVVVMDPDYLAHFYDDLLPDEAGYAVVVGTHDYVVRASGAGAPAELGTGGVLAPTDPLRVALAPDDAPGAQGLRVAACSEGTIVRYRRLPDHPLAVAVHLNESVYLQSFRTRTRLLVWAASVMTLLILFAEARKALLFRRLDSALQRERDMGQVVAAKAAGIEALFKAIPDAVVGFSAGGEVEGFNPRLRELLGLGNEEVRGLTPAGFAERLFAHDTSADREEKIEAVAAALGLARLGRQARSIHRVQTPDTMVYEVRIEPVPRPFSGTVVLVRDITAQARVDRMKSEFVSTAAHELRTPTAGILGMSELLAQGRVPPARLQDVYERIRDQAKGLAEVLSDLLDLARIEARVDRDFGREPFDVVSTAAAVLDSDPSWAGRTSLITPGAPVRVWGEPAQMAVAVRNLLENAAKYSAPGTPIVLRIEPDVDAGTVRLTVEDRGIGLTQEECERVFDRFYRVEGNAGTPGTGLGLALVKEIAALHGGRAWIESTPGIGSRAILEVRLHG